MFKFGIFGNWSIFIRNCLDILYKINRIEEKTSICKDGSLKNNIIMEGYYEEKKVKHKLGA